jgi:hypothetical protein
VSVTLSVVPGVKMEDVEEEQPARRKEHRRVPSKIAMDEVKAAVAEGEAPPGLPMKKSGTAPSVPQSEERVGVNMKATDALAGELWENKKERIRRTSKWSSNSDWDLRSMIVKSGDDCRQEHLAVQLVAHFYGKSLFSWPSMYYYIFLLLLLSHFSCQHGIHLMWLLLSGLKFAEGCIFLLVLLPCHLRDVSVQNKVLCLP